ncbi:MAG: hypothetical protein PHI05_00585 [Bacilli bacterium]|nr:hypothetical protein [Bacilli bacterium]MDD4547237.1 hypothetical protein [Bacilli bacterium]
MKKRKLNVKRITILVLAIIAIIASVVIILKLTKPANEPKDPKIISEINGYTLKEGASAYFKNIFGELETELSKDEVDENKYAEIISKLFISDCFTLSNKMNHNDIGGVQFVYEQFQNDYISIARETLYNNIENDIYGNRKQELPTVKNVTIKSFEEDTYEYGENEDPKAYNVVATIEYDKDLGYPEEVSIVIIHSNNKLEVAKMN